MEYKEAEYPLVIVAMEEIIEIRLKATPLDKPDLSGSKRKSSKQRRG
jgi:hypothetical protein